MTKYRTLDTVEESYFREHPYELDDYLAEIFDAYAEDGDSAALLASLRIIAKVKDITAIAGNRYDNDLKELAKIEALQ